VWKKLIEGKKAIFFDLDGTIVDTSPLWISAIRKVLERIGVDWISDENMYEPGKDLMEQWALLLKKYSIKTDKDITVLTKETGEEFLRNLEEADLEAKPGFWDFLYEIKEEKGFKAVLLTNSTRVTALEILKAIQAENSFDLIVCGDEIKKPKPDPEIFNKALESMGLKPVEVLVFEDSLSGVEAARLANLEIVVIWDETHQQSEYDGKIYMFMPDFTPLPGYLDLTYNEWLNYHIELRKEKQKKLQETKASDLGKEI
jgi:beta-phosphoglucomutase